MRIIETGFYRSFREFISAMNERSGEFHRIVAHPVPEQPFTEKPAAEKILLTIGPEGGFDEAEIEDALNSGAVPITLGRRILRTETAGLTVLSILMYHLEGKDIE